MRKRKPKVGRPALPAEQAKGKTFSVRFTEDERAQIEAAADRAGARSASDWARRVLLDAAISTVTRV